MVWVEAGSGMEHDPEDGCAPPREVDERLGAVLSLVPLAIVEGERGWISGGDGAEGTHVEDALEVLVAAEGPVERAGLAGLLQHRGEACGCGCGRGLGRAEVAAGDGDGFCLFSRRCT